MRYQNKAHPRTSSLFSRTLGLSWTTTRNSYFPGGTVTDEEAIVRNVVKRGAILALESENARREFMFSGYGDVVFMYRTEDEVVLVWRWAPSCGVVIAVIGGVSLKGVGVDDDSAPLGSRSGLSCLGLYSQCWGLFFSVEVLELVRIMNSMVNCAPKGQKY